VAYLLFLIFYLGLNFGKVSLTGPSDDSVKWFNSVLIYLFLTGFFLLLLFQRNNSKDVIPYLHLPFKRNKIITYLLMITSCNFFTLGFISFLISFSISTVFQVYGLHDSLLYLMGLLLLLMIESYLVLLFKNLIGLAFPVQLLILVIASLLIILKVVLHISMEEISADFFQRLLSGDIILILFLILTLFILLIVNFRLLKNAIYYNDSQTSGVLWIFKKTKSYSFINEHFSYALLEIRLITRNKRLSGFFIIAIVFIFLFYYIIQNEQNSIYLSFIIFIILSGIFGYLFSQYLFSWESSFFDFISVRTFSVSKYLRAKHIIYTSLGLILLLFYLPLVIQGKMDIHLYLTALLYNSSIGYFIIFYMATFNTSRIDLGNSIFFNMQGYNVIQMITIMIIIILPLLLLLFLTSIFSVPQSLIIMNILSVLILSFHRKWYKIILQQLYRRKHINMEGYRR
ncbi:MAG TPA: DUF5687 family protein, partial [Bacteroidales bacterium]|nr:DUF5687 family protein [Bacteroidales bacterium]